MEIQEEKELNQSVGKYKVMSTNAGVGSIVTTTWGGFVMPMTSSCWKFINVLQSKLSQNDSNVDFKTLPKEIGVELIDDERFVNFLRKSEDLKSLKCLAAIPHINLTLHNTCDVENHPLNIQYKDNHPEQRGGLSEEMFTIPAIVFPRWFRSGGNNHELKRIEEWGEIWKRKKCNNGELKYFAPPRDPYRKTRRKLQIHDNRFPEDKKYLHELLEQVSMVLICPKGHISDIPWLQYFCAKCNGEKLNELGYNLFDYDVSTCECSNTKGHELQWIENRNNPESFGTLKCKKCGKYVSLEGIMNIRPHCPGERPWEGTDVHDNCNEAMRWAMVTGNSVYYAETFSSLYIPAPYLGRKLNEKQKSVLRLMGSRWRDIYSKHNPDSTLQQYIDTGLTLDKVIEKSEISGYELSQDEAREVIAAFQQVENNKTTDSQSVLDVRETYRFDEYSVFVNNAKSLETSDQLRFKDIDLPEVLKPYFSKIQQVSTLALTTTQLNFARVEMPQPKLSEKGKIEYPSSMKIFKGSAEDVMVMPANQTYGEGLFFSFSKDKLAIWLNENDNFKSRYNIGKTDSIYESLNEKMKRGGYAKFYLLHTFSHVLMKELEFSCGYPAASLSERLYFSERMCGVLIYTTDGSEGGMGGLVWQGQPDLLKDIIISAMQRALDCASDPICWENHDQLNYAACFSCAMVSETSCEERNLELDRCILIDEEYGYFKDLINIVE